jgi:hypothetical protein
VLPSGDAQCHEKRHLVGGDHRGTYLAVLARPGAHDRWNSPQSSFTSACQVARDQGLVASRTGRGPHRHAASEAASFELRGRQPSRASHRTSAAAMPSNNQDGESLKEHRHTSESRADVGGEVQQVLHRPG